MRDAYNRELSAEEKRILETNPAYFAEIYIMRADGSGATRLTRTGGYDGGPFFFPNGERIVFRRFDAEGLIADVYSMKPDGTDLRRITDFSSMSWAPYVHPSGEYLFFASNKLGFENFEIFLVDTEGTKEPVRDHLYRRLRRASRALARRRAALLDFEPRIRRRRADLHRALRTTRQPSRR